MVEFMLYKQGKLVTLSWQTFSCSITSAGAEYLAVTQSIDWLPYRIQDYVIRVAHKGITKPSFIRIDPKAAEPIRFYISIDGTGVGTNVDGRDTFIVAGSSVSWLAAC